MGRMASCLLGSYTDMPHVWHRILETFSFYLSQPWADNGHHAAPSTHHPFLSALTKEYTLESVGGGVGYVRIWNVLTWLEQKAGPGEQGHELASTETESSPDNGGVENHLNVIWGGVIVLPFNMEKNIIRAGWRCNKVQAEQGRGVTQT